MAFTNPWSNIIPAGSDPANTADDEIRQLRFDIDERMDTIVPDWSADPIVVLADIRKTVHWSEGSFDPLGNDTLTEGYEVFGVGLHALSAGTTLVWRNIMNLPVGATLQKVVCRCFKNNPLASFVIEIVEADDALPSEFVLETEPVLSVTGWVDHEVGTSPLGLVVAVDKPLMIKYNIAIGAAGATSAMIFQAHYEYDIPAALTGITG